MPYLVSMAADLNTVKLHINLKGQKLHLSSVVTSEFYIVLEKKIPRPSLNFIFKKPPKHIKSLHSISLMLNIKRSACQTIPLFYLESTVIQNASISSVCVGWICLYHVRLKSKIRKTVTK